MDIWQLLDAAIAAAPKLLTAVDLIAVAVFAITGALVASRKQMDIVGFVWLGIVTGVGGGTLRDLLLDEPVFWVLDATPVIVCMSASVVVFFLAHLIQNRYRLILWLDAVGLGLFTVAGANKALEVGASPVVAVTMGVISATVGGVVRDILGQEPSIILRREIYVTASAIGATIFVALQVTALSLASTMTIAFLATFIIRGSALMFGWSLPDYKPRPGRKIDPSDSL